MHIDFSIRETRFVHGTYCMLIVCSWSLLRGDSCLCNMLHVDFSLCETCTLILSSYETDFVHGTSCMLIFWSRNLLGAGFFFRGTSCILIFFRKIVH